MIRAHQELEAAERPHNSELKKKRPFSKPDIFGAGLEMPTFFALEEEARWTPLLEAASILGFRRKNEAAVGRGVSATKIAIPFLSRR